MVTFALDWQFLQEPELEMVHVFYRMYLVLPLLSVVWMLARFWRALGVTSKNTWNVLEKTLDFLRRGDLSAASEQLLKLSPNSPEAALRDWTSQPSKDNGTAFLQVLRRGDIRFNFALARLNTTLKLLTMLLGLTVLLSLLLVTRDLSSILAGMSSEKTTWDWVVHGQLSQTAFLLYQGMWDATILFLTYSYLAGRISRRKTYWQHFCDCAKEIQR